MIFDAAYTDSCSVVGLVARRGDSQQLHELLEHGVDFSIRDNRGWYPIHEAASKGHCKCVELLLKAGLSENCEDSILDVWPNPYDDILYGSPLYLAASIGHVETTKLLIPYFVKRYSEEITHALFGATRHPVVFQLLLEYCEINESYYNDTPILHQTISDCVIDNVKVLLEKGAEVGIIDKFGRGPLHVAAALQPAPNVLEIIRLLIEFKCNINKQDDAGCTPMYIAAQNGNKEMLSLLLEHGADPHLFSLFYDHYNDEDIRSCPICVCCEKGFVSCLETLIPFTQPQVLGDNNVCSPVISAIVGEQLDCLNILISSGYNIDGSLPSNSSDQERFSYLDEKSHIFDVMLPWSRAKSRKYVDILEILILNGSSISHLTSQYSFCTLMKLSNPLSVDIISCLIEHGLIEALCCRWNMTFQYYSSDFATQVYQMVMISIKSCEQDSIALFGSKLDLLFEHAFKTSGRTLLDSISQNKNFLESNHTVVKTVQNYSKIPALVSLTRFRVRQIIFKCGGYSLNKIYHLPLPKYIVQDILL